jgi:hypothetical protein
MAIHTCNPSTPEGEAGGLRVPGQPRLHTKTLSQTSKQNTIKSIRHKREDITTAKLRF